jgi:hypothetical protein
LILAQLGIITFELVSPAIFVLKPRERNWAVAFFYSFHLVTFATITISFAPHLAAITSFLRWNGFVRGMGARFHDPRPGTCKGA